MHFVLGPVGLLVEVNVVAEDIVANGLLATHPGARELRDKLLALLPNIDDLPTPQEKSDAAQFALAALYATLLHLATAGCPNPDCPAHSRIRERRGQTTMRNALSELLKTLPTAEPGTPSWEGIAQQLRDREEQARRKEDELRNSPPPPPPPDGGATS